MGGDGARSRHLGRAWGHHLCLTDIIFYLFKCSAKHLNKIILEDTTVTTFETLPKQLKLHCQLHKVYVTKTGVNNKPMKKNFSIATGNRSLLKSLTKLASTEMPNICQNEIQTFAA